VLVSTGGLVAFGAPDQSKVALIHFALSYFFQPLDD
jgi:hypothetical protein